MRPCGFVWLLGVSANFRGLVAWDCGYYATRVGGVPRAAAGSY